MEYVKGNTYVTEEYTRTEESLKEADAAKEDEKLQQQKVQEMHKKAC